jgi:endonuclease YncB( thermonuclease family)
MVLRLIMPLACVVIPFLWRLPLSAEPPSHATMVLERVIDGDTFVASGLKIRVWGIDAPERGEPLYQHSRLLLEQILQNGALSCASVDRDRYARVVMQCRSDEADIGALMVRAVFARYHARYSKGFYAEEQDAAQSAGAGLWN